MAPGEDQIHVVCFHDMSALVGIVNVEFWYGTPTEDQTLDSAVKIN